MDEFKGFNPDGFMLLEMNKFKTQEISTKA